LVFHVKLPIQDPMTRWLQERALDPARQGVEQVVCANPKCRETSTTKPHGCVPKDWCAVWIADEMTSFRCCSMECAQTIKQAFAQPMTVQKTPT
jgi:hypothetical protein